MTASVSETLTPDGQEPEDGVCVALAAWIKHILEIPSTKGKYILEKRQDDKQHQRRLHRLKGSISRAVHALQGALAASQ